MNRFRFACMGLFLTLLPLGSPCRGQPLDVDSTIQLFAAGVEDNMNAIKTWSGTAAVEVRQYMEYPPNSGNRVWYQSKGVVEFELDVAQNKLRNHYRQAEALMDGQSRDTQPSEILSIRKPQESIVYWPNRKVGEQGTTDGIAEVMHPEELKNKISDNGRGLDPRHLVWVQKLQPPGFFLRHYLSSELQAECTFKYEHPILTIKHTPTDAFLPVTEEIRFDAEQGYNLVYYALTDNQTFRNVWTRKFKQHQSGIWLPEMELNENYSSHSLADQPVHSRKVTLGEQVVNSDIDPKRFELASFSMASGDQVYDSRSGIRYSIGNPGSSVETGILKDISISERKPSSDSPYSPDPTTVEDSIAGTPAVRTVGGDSLSSASPPNEKQEDGIPLPYLLVAILAMAGLSSAFLILRGMQGRKPGGG